MALTRLGRAFSSGVSEMDVGSNRGFTLSEIVVAVFVITIGILGIAPLMNSVISSNILARNTSIASNLARERIEEIRSWPRYDYDPVLGLCGIQAQNAAWGGNGNCSTANPDGVIVETNITVGDVPQKFTRTTNIVSNTNLSNVEKIAGGDTNPSGDPPIEYRHIRVTVSWTTPFELEGGAPKTRSVILRSSVAKF